MKLRGVNALTWGLLLLLLCCQVVMAANVVITMYVTVPPTVDLSSATNITHYSGTIRGNITDTGGANASTRGFEWGNSTGNYTISWNETGSFGVGAFSHTVSNLTAGETVFWRAFAVNIIGTGYSGEGNFTTLSLPYAPSNFTLTQTGAGSVNITWTMGPLATLIIIRGYDNGYPLNVTDGYPVYSGNGTSVVVDNLNLDTTTYGYRAWSWNSYGYSIDYAEGTVGGNMNSSLLMFGLLGFCGIISYLSMRSRFYLFKLLAGAAWIAMFIWWMYSPPTSMAAGTPPHIAIMVVLIGLAVATPIMGLGREIQTQTDWRTGAKSEGTSLFKFKMPDWMKGTEERAAKERRQSVEEYRERIHKALNPGSKGEKRE